MDKANIIISIIIVLCIAAAVASYGITNSDSPIFSDLSSMSSDSDTGDGIGNNTTTGNGSGISITTDTINDGGSGSGPSSSSSSGSGPSYSSGHRSSGSSSSSSGSGSGSGSSSSGVSASYIKSDAWSHIGEAGCYPGTPYKSGSYWYVTIYDANDTVVDSFQYSSSGSFLGRG